MYAMYVIQYLSYPPWNHKWFPLPERYGTLAEAQAAFDALPHVMRPDHRIAEVYIVTRYKPQK